MNYADWKTIEEKIRARLSGDLAHPSLVDSFLHNTRLVFDGMTGLTPETVIDPVWETPDLDQFPGLMREQAQEILRQVVMIKLNGGLGTSMGLDKAKALLPAKNNLSFLDIISRQVLYLRDHFGVPLPLLFMTSYNTDADTLTALDNYPALAQGQPGLPLTFRQNRVPKLMTDTLLPARFPDHPDLAWCPPGHGDIYTALITQGLLKQLIGMDIRYAFFSNADNLGAVIDPVIPAYMREHDIPFLMEVADRTEADRKGGHVARRTSDRRLILRESVQCPPDQMDRFQDIHTYRYFNTNNLWLDLVRLEKSVLASGSVPELDVIINRKTLDPRDPQSTQVIQLETAMGSIISHFDGAVALRVPRSRFAPVKTTDDLLGLWSDAYELTQDMHVRLSSRRKLSGPPIIRLDPAYYRRMDQFTAHLPHGAPSLVDCRSLTVKGDYVFPANLVISGDVVIDH